MMASKGSSLNSVNLASRDETENSIESRLSELDKEEFEKLPRIVEKDGTVNVVNKSKGKWFEMNDYSLLLRIQWVSFIVVSVVTFVASYTFFAFLVFNIHRYNENVIEAKNNETDFTDVFVDDEDIEIKVQQQKQREHWRRRHTCFYGIEGFGDAFLFALETMTTIGYGTKYPNPWCPEVIVKP